MSTQVFDEIEIAIMTPSLLDGKKQHFRISFKPTLNLAILVSRIINNDEVIATGLEPRTT